MEYKMIIAGDIFPADSNKELFIKGDGERLYGREIINLFQNADFITEGFHLIHEVGGEENGQPLVF